MKKRINTRVKGRNAELELKKLFEDSGWTCLLTPPPKKYNLENDFFNLFDLITFKGAYRKYIQIKCNKKPPFKKYEEWRKKFANQYESVEVWVRKDGKSKNERWESHIMEAA